MRGKSWLPAAAITVCGWLWPGLAAAAVLVELQGEPGAAMLDGGSRTVTGDTHTLVTLNAAENGMHFRLESSLGGDLFWPDFEFGARAGDALIGTHHFDLSRPAGAANASVLVQSVQNSCSYGEGWFVVYQFEGNNSTGITRLAMEFQFRCSGYSGILRGRIQINNTVSIPNPVLTALPNGPKYADEGETVQLDGHWSRRGSQFPIESYSWRQVAGPTVQLQNANTAQPSFVAATPSTTTSVARFELTVRDSAGNTAVALTETQVVGRSVPKTFVALQSDPAEYVLRGESLMMREPEITIDASVSNYERQQISIDAGYQIWIISPEGQPLAVGNYENAQRFASPTLPQLTFFGNGSGCNGEVGRFTIYELQINANTQAIERLAFDFDRRCNSNPDSDQRAYGQVRINSSVPRVHVAPQASAGSDRVEAEQTSVELDGSGSRPGSSAIVSWQWTQTAGPAVTLSNGNSPQPRFTTPAVASGSTSLTFQLLVTDANGNSDTDVLNVRVVSGAQPRTVLLVDGRAGDYVGSGRYFTLDEDDGRFLVTRDPTGWLLYTIEAGEDSFGFGVRARDFGALAEGNYERASTSPARPGVSAGTFGRGCNESTGRFTIREIVFAPGTDTIQRFAADIEHYCDGQSEPLFASLRFNSSVPLKVAAPTAAAGNEQTVLERSRVSLDGRNSRGGNGTLSAWQWRQLTGPLVTLSDASSSLAQFESPASANPQTLRFELKVTSSTGLTDTDVIDIHVQPRTAPRSYAIITEPNATKLLPEDGNFVTHVTSTNAGPGVARIEWRAGIDNWYFEFYNPEAVPLVAGNTYTVTGTGGLPAFGIWNLFTCGNTTGSFTVRDVAFSGNTPTRLAVDFEQLCGPSVPLRGKLRYNVQSPDANAGPDSTNLGRSAVSLSGAASLPVSSGSIASYAWRQLSGPAVTLIGATTSSASFTAPDVVAITPMEFELTVIDNRGLDAADTKVVTVEPAPPIPPAPPVTPPPSGGGSSSSGGSAGSGGGGSWDALALAALGLILLVNRFSTLRARRVANAATLPRRRAFW